MLQQPVCQSSVDIFVGNAAAIAMRISEETAMRIPEATAMCIPEATAMCILEEIAMRILDCFLLCQHWKKRSQCGYWTVFCYASTGMDIIQMSIPEQNLAYTTIVLRRWNQNCRQKRKRNFRLAKEVLSVNPAGETWYLALQRDHDNISAQLSNSLVFEGYRISSEITLGLMSLQVTTARQRNTPFTAAVYRMESIYFYSHNIYTNCNRKGSKPRIQFQDGLRR